ncbi:MAG: sulfite exporter TauE/SafE family protein [Fluviicola sp.]|nr:sulfite exporter TauE/SafE family protein [Fluviicola sp.]MBP6272508.1 sulfite exporter TauE/SafE family protein [Fluviicola sp.]
MTFQIITILVIIGLAAGILSGLIGVGGGIIIVPALVFFLGLSQKEASGTSLFILSMPVVILGVMNYWKAGQVNWKYGLVIAGTFLIGGYVGSKFAAKISPAVIKVIFGVIMLYVAFVMIRSGILTWKDEE